MYIYIYVHVEGEWEVQHRQPAFSWQTPATERQSPVVIKPTQGAVARLLKIIGLFCKRALRKSRHSAKKTYDFKGLCDSQMGTANWNWPSLENTLRPSLENTFQGAVARESYPLRRAPRVFHRAVGYKFRITGLFDRVVLNSYRAFRSVSQGAKTCLGKPSALYMKHLNLSNSRLT